MHLRGEIRYIAYIIDKNGHLGHVVLSIYNLSLLVSNHCSFRNYNDKKEFEYFLNSLRGVPTESNDINYRWRII